MNEIHDIEIERLHANPHNSNVMGERMLAKLVRHIQGSGRYPPIIVRPHADAYEILDGHHRVEALRRLDHTTARCLVWPVDDDEALWLLATLNRLQGQDDARKRAALLRELGQRVEQAELARHLPDSDKRLKRLREMTATVARPRPPQPVDAMPEAVHFFLLPTQRRRLEARLRELGGTREQALMSLVERAGPAENREEAKGAKDAKGV